MALVTLAEVKNYLSISSTTDDDKFSNLINFASTMVENYCSRNFVSNNYIEYLDGGRSSVMIRNIPVTKINSVQEYSGIEYIILKGPLSDGALPNTRANANATIEFSWDGETGIISRNTGDGEGFPELDLSPPLAFRNFKKGVRIEYVGGYSATPNDIKVIVMELVEEMHKREGGISTFSLAGESQQLVIPRDYPPHIKRVLDLYRLIV